MSSTYQHFFWTVAIDNADTSAKPTDIGVAKRAQLRKAALDLNSIPSILLAIADGGTAAAHPEIALILAVEEHDTVNEYTTHIDKALTTHGLQAKPTLQAETRFYTFDEAELKRVRECQCIPSGKEEKAEIYRFIESAETVPLPSANAPQQEGPESFTITAEKYNELKDAKGDELRDALKKLYDTLYNLRDERKASVIIPALASVGIVTVGGAMYTTYTALQFAGFLSAFPLLQMKVSFITAATLTVGVSLSIVFAIAAAVMTSLFLMLKDATNILLLANDSDFALTFASDVVANGKRSSVVTTIPAMIKAHNGAPAVYPCGAFVYQKVSGSWFGSLFGAEFSASRDGKTDTVSVGMDCPNSAIGGGNTIFVTGQGAQKAADGAHDRSSDNEEDTAQTSHGRITGRRANRWGFTNYGFAFYKA
ncbi:hypothetical protein BV22DRAFT_737694 [Leucogyrophana mollusca]|uniref:Uncharacterized protein n=1 Tax=Leucogyrophana mollusca TaxID=85980 RepID=A0ACB8B717_9AGAM|nr:hypothetical protein BV22DRAFT_737694 [Leucogyrophana mollusca]